MGPFPFEGEEDADFINAGKQTITTLQEPCCLIQQHHCNDQRPTRSFNSFRAMEVSQNGDIANWKIPKKMVKGMGSYGFSSFSRNIIVAMMHTNKKGDSKILKSYQLQEKTV